MNILNLVKAFEMSNIKDWHDLYREIDVLLLTCGH